MEAHVNNILKIFILHEFINRRAVSARAEGKKKKIKIIATIAS